MTKTGKVARPSQTSRRTVEDWARREIQAAATAAERDLMAIVTHRVASLFAPEHGPGRVTAVDWDSMIARSACPDIQAGAHQKKNKTKT